MLFVFPFALISFWKDKKLRLLLFSSDGQIIGLTGYFNQGLESGKYSSNLS